MRRRAKGFTLLEIMIIVLIIGILIGIAVPNFINARQNARRTTCVEILKQIDSAKERLAMEQKLANGTVVTWADIAGAAGYIKGPATGAICPGGGTYNIGPIGTLPTCSRSTAPDLHILP